MSNNKTKTTGETAPQDDSPIARMHADPQRWIKQMIDNAKARRKGKKTSALTPIGATDDTARDQSSLSLRPANDRRRPTMLPAFLSTGFYSATRIRS